MVKIITLMAAIVALAVQIAPAQAQLDRSYVAAGGNNANDCDRGTPCRTFARAHAVTNPGGGITVLSGGDYEPVVITKAISIVADGVGQAGVRIVGSGPAITINAAAGDAVNLRGLTITGPDAVEGIRFNSGRSLSVEKCVIRNIGKTIGGVAITFMPTASSSLAVSDTLMADNGYGVAIHPIGTAAPTVKASLNRVTVQNNAINGINVAGSGLPSVSVTDSVSANNGANGIIVGGSFGGVVTVIRSVVADNGWSGLAATEPRAILRIGQSRVTGNARTWQTFGIGVVASYADNDIDNNADGNPPLPVVILMR